MLFDRLRTYLAAKLGVRPGVRSSGSLGELSNQDLDNYFKENSP